MVLIKHCQCEAEHAHEVGNARMLISKQCRVGDLFKHDSMR